jgi:hypothetical protein
MKRETAEPSVRGVGRGAAVAKRHEQHAPPPRKPGGEERELPDLVPVVRAQAADELSERDAEHLAEQEAREHRWRRSYGIVSPIQGER